jgi:hypothetical protein
MHKNLGPRTLAIGALTLLVGVACSQNNKQPEPTTDQRLTSMFQQESPGYDARDKTFRDVVNGSPTLSPLSSNTSPTGQITWTASVKGIKDPLIFTSDTVTYASIKPNKSISLNLSDDQESNVQSTLGYYLSANVKCLDAKCSQVGVIMQSSHFVGGSQAGATFVYVQDSKGNYVLDIDSLGITKVALK